MTSSSSPETFSSTTFSSAAYAAHRPAYPPALLSHILPSVTSGRSLALDLGCGPGTFTSTLAPHFDRVIGIDPSEVMLAAIDRAAVPANVEFRVGRAEKMEGVADGTVDLVTVGMGAHWFAREWLGEAKRVALFMYTTGLPDPATPNVGIILAAMSELKAALMPFHEVRNPLVENLYDDLPVPVEGDGWGSVIRCKWLTKAAVKAREPFFMSMTSKVSDMRAALSTGMSMFRWREGHPEVEPEADILTVFVEKVKAAIGGTDETELRMGLDVALVLVQKL